MVDYVNIQTPKTSPKTTAAAALEEIELEERNGGGGDVNEVSFAFLEGAPDTPDVDSRVGNGGGGGGGDSVGVNGSGGRRGGGEYVVEERRVDEGRNVGGGGGGGGRGGFWGEAQDGGGGGVMGAAEGDRRRMFVVVLFLVLLGIIPSGVIFGVDVSVHRLFELRGRVAEGGNGVVGFVVYVVGGVVLCLVGTLVCRVWSMEAEGSGIPQMKAIMSGFYDRMKPALSLWALLAKSVGLICVIAGGLPVGWEGPNVHISCIVAHHLGRLPVFKSLRKDRALRMQFMLCACSVGLASSFGTPIGGVLYALETTGSFYLVPTFWKSILATIAGALVYDMLYKTPLVEAFENTSFVAGDYMRRELMAFAFMGVIMGLMGAFFVKCVYAVYFARKRRLPGTSRYVIVGTVAFLAAILQYPLRLFRLDPRSAINEFFSASNLENFAILDMLLLVVVKFPLIVVSIGLPVPAGVFIPCFLLGSGFGRLYGELLKLIFGSAIVPGGYAVVGAAAFTAGVTRALSCAVVIFEVTGQLKHMVPTLVAVLLSVITANSINRSLYDVLIIMKQLPYMPHMRRDLSPRRQCVEDVMKKDVVMIERKGSVDDVRQVLDEYQQWDSFPVVDSKMERRVLGSVRRKTLVEMLARGDHGGSSSSNGAVSINIKEEERLGAGRNERNGVAGVGEGDITQGTAMDSGSEEDVAIMRFGREEDGSSGRRREREGGRVANGVKGRVCEVTADLSPLVVTGNTSLGQLHFMFVMLMPTHALVTVGGKLAGIITRTDIVQSGHDAG